MRFFITIFLIASCTKMHDIKTDNGIDFLENVSVKITNVKVVEWDVGRKKDKLVSRGIRVTTTVPRVSDDAKELLYSKYGIDSWIFKFSRINRGKKDLVGNIFYHFNNISKSTEAFSLNIYYHASSVSERFRAFHCPAFDHRSILKDVDVEYSKSVAPENIYVRTLSSEPAKVERLSFSPHIFSAGRSLRGDFIVEYALYNSKTKQIYSDWKSAEGMIPITREEKVSLPSCLGIKEEEKPLPESRRFKLQDLEIN